MYFYISVINRIGSQVGYIFSQTNGYPTFDLWCTRQLSSVSKAEKGGAKFKFFPIESRPSMESSFHPRHLHRSLPQPRPTPSLEAELELALEVVLHPTPGRGSRGCR